MWKREGRSRERMESGGGRTSVISKDKDKDAEVDGRDKRRMRVIK
jgi:hypothetical protein